MILEYIFVKAPEVVKTDKVKADKFNAAHYSTGLRGASLTSTAYDRITEGEAAILDDEVVKYRKQDLYKIQ